MTKAVNMPFSNAPNYGLSILLGLAICYQYVYPLHRSRFVDAVWFIDLTNSVFLHYLVSIF